MNFNDKLKKFKEFYNIDFSLLGKTEIEQKQNMAKVITDITYTADLKHVYGGT